ncbi:MAG: hypothetical protein ACXACR_09955 [Candidatus Hodarchaeales archaeon]|jgi:hypothetical protein
MKEFNEQRSTCTYRDKQKCNYWGRETQCHQLACPIISQKLYDQTELSVPRRIIESIDNFDNRHLDRITPIDRDISKNAQRGQGNGIQQKEPPIKETQGTTVVTITSKQTETKVPHKYKESAKEIKDSSDDTSESVDQHLTETTNFSPTERLHQQPQSFQERQETIVVTPGQIECDRCGNPINTETCTNIRDPSGDIFYIHPNGQCLPRLDKIEEVRERWLKKRK